MFGSKEWVEDIENYINLSKLKKINFILKTLIKRIKKEKNIKNIVYLTALYLNIKDYYKSKKKILLIIETNLNLA